MILKMFKDFVLGTQTSSHFAIKNTHTGRYAMIEYNSVSSAGWPRRPAHERGVSRVWWTTEPEKIGSKLKHAQQVVAALRVWENNEHARLIEEVANPPLRPSWYSYTDPQVQLDEFNANVFSAVIEVVSIEYSLTISESIV